MVDGNKLGSVGFNYIGRSYDEMDCQKFVERCLKDCGNNTDLGGSNSWYREVYKHGEILTPEECAKKYGTTPKGAFLFILKFDGKEPEKYRNDGLGNADHIGICTKPEGKGAIHSSYTIHHVAESAYNNKSINGGWNRVGLWDQVSYSGVGPSPEPHPTPGPEPEPGPEPQPQPTPTPTPEPVYAVVDTGGNGKLLTHPKKGSSALSKAGKLDEGTPVEILKESRDWAYIGVVDKNGAKWYCWVKSRFLRIVDPDVDPEPDPQPEPLTYYYTVIIKHLPEMQADALLDRYPGAEKRKEAD